eukprot:TRINITY_DN28165_c0_g1_i1.p1 TRINITY_DN28165_c0_g1~~TRINITY_DN28165_c0_g1_i1.p1  ORF type:complete len:109 (-),score=7.19 TRINITY_DN28165_c0_g1_i1:74-400(-)
MSTLPASFSSILVSYLGRFLSLVVIHGQTWQDWQLHHLFLSIARLFHPLSFLQHQASRERPHLVAFESDVAYIIIMLLFSLSNGYIGSICMISVPRWSGARRLRLQLA